MNNELELITTDAPELARVVSTAALEPTTGERLIRGFAPFFRDAKTILDTSRTITVTDATQVTEIKASRENRLKLRAVRIAADKTRKELKEDSMKLGTAIQSVYNILILDIEKEEKRLQDSEDFAARAEAARKEKLKAERTAALVNADALADLAGYDLAAMPDASFGSLLESFKRAASERKAAAERAEAERVERERLAAEEAARKEAELLAALAEAKRVAAELARVEAAAKAERESAAAEAKRLADEARAEQLKRDAEIIAQRAAEKAECDRLQAIADAAADEERRLAKSEAERLAEEARKAREEYARLAKIEVDRIAAEAKAKAEAAESARLAAQAPDKEKLVAFAASVEALTVPEVTTEAAQKVRTEVSAKVRNFANWIRAQSAGL